MEFFNSTRGMSPDALAKAVEREFADLHYISDTRLARLCHTDVDGLEHVQKLEITLDAAISNGGDIAVRGPITLSPPFNADLRARIRALGAFTQAHTSKVLRDGAPLGPLIEINTAVMRGLSGARGCQ